jgi:tetratricopeptide (TPR) repeat protein
MKTEAQNSKRKTQNAKVKWFVWNQKTAEFCVLSFVFCVLSFSAAWAGTRSNTAIRAFNEGVKAFNNQEFNQAIPRFDEAIAADPEFAEAYFARGACRHYLKSLDGAMMDLGDAIRLKPDYWEARALRGAVHYEADRWDAAMDDFNYVLARQPRDVQSLLGRAVILLKREDLVAAQRDFRAFLQVRPDDPLAPKVRELLASLKRGGLESPRQEAQPPPRTRPGETARPPAVDPQKLADTLLAHPLKEAYSRKVLRGERAQAVGDIRSVPSAPAPSRSPGSPEGVSIVEPQ